MTSIDKNLTEEAILFAKDNKKIIAQKFTSIDIYSSDEAPVSVFMAGSPGAGKTEFARRILEVLEKDHHKVVHIDPDILRNEFPKYNGTNSYLFQAGVSILVDKIHDCVLNNNQNFIFDGTLSDLEKARKNIGRSLNKNRLIEIFFVYQRPEIAWKFVCEREKQEGRMIPKEAFISHFLSSQHVVNSIKEIFGKKVNLNIVIKDIDNSDLTYKENISKIDPHLPKKYSKEELERLLT